MIYITPKESIVNKARKDIRIRDRFKNYNETFILLNPFYKLKNGHKKIDLLKFEEYPTKEEVIENFRRYTWEEFGENYSTKNIKEIAEFINKYWEVKRDDKLSAEIKMEEGLFFPNESYLSEFLINPIVKSLINQGYKSIEIWSELEEEERNEIELSKILSTNYEFPGNFRFETNDKKILFWQEFDLTTTFINSSKEQIQILIKEAKLEGFYCNEYTTLLWSQ